MEGSTKQNRVRKRTPNACQRCRQQKIRCSGLRPCNQCTSRKVYCTFEDRTQKVFVTRGYIDDLQERVAAYEHGMDANAHASQMPQSFEAGNELGQNQSGVPQLISASERDQPAGASGAAAVADHHLGHDETPQSSSGRTSPEPPITNHLATGTSPAYVSDQHGKPIYLGTSSNWSFGRRVLAMAHERVLKLPLPTENLLYEGKVYSFNWVDMLAVHRMHDKSKGLPSSDFAIYLINAVKFHCGQMFHLFDEENFMRNFSTFHEEASGGRGQVSQTWYVHYLLLMALGKAFVVKVGKEKEPPGADLFGLAMQSLPNLVFLCADPIESMEVLCCASLYLHSLDFRGSAYHLIGQALRIALENGLHTDMTGEHISGTLSQRCQKIWWTIHVLDRQMSALMGVPMAVRDEDITAKLPAYPGAPHKELGLSLHVRFSNIISQISRKVYGVEGRPGKEYLINTREVLTQLASITDQLNATFALSTHDDTAGISRMSAYLHLLHQQCVLLAIRPLFFSFLLLRLDSQDLSRCYVPQSGSVRALLYVGIEAARSILKVLAALQMQDLLESFLPFDLDATFTATIVLLMAPAADTSLADRDDEWWSTAQTVLSEMISRGNQVARYLEAELEHLKGILARLPPAVPVRSKLKHARKSGSASRRHEQGDVGISSGTPAGSISGTSSLGLPTSAESFHWQDGLTAENLNTVAETLDLDGLEWLSSDVFDFTT